MMNINYLTNANELSKIELFEEAGMTDSPFMLYDDESLRICENEAPVSMYVTDTDKQIITLVNKYRILTHMQILNALGKFFDTDIIDGYLKNRLKLLVKANYLQMSEISCDDGRVCSARFYSIGYRGRGLMKALGALHVCSYIAQIADNPSDVKRVVSCNQFLINCGIPFESVESGQVVAAQPKTAVGDLIFRTTATINGDNTVFVEAVRTSDTGFEQLDNKLDRMKKVLKKRNVNIKVNDPQLVIVCESIDHMMKMLEYLAGKRLPFDVCCTCDQLTYKSPDNCLYAVQRKRSIFGITLRAA